VTISSGICVFATTAWFQPHEGVRQLYTDHGAKEKVFIDLGCSSHNAMWEKNHLILFKATLEWLTAGSVNGQKEGMLKLGY
jgi:hypothetical protein